MKNNQLYKIIQFCVLLSAFVVVSFALRNLLINKFNGFDLKLFSIEHIDNYGAAFSILQNHTILLITISALVLISALVYIFKNIETFKKNDIILTAMLASGIICNLSERILDGHVTDYLKLNFVAFPIFNISDVFICIGAFILICNILFNDEREN